MKRKHETSHSWKTQKIKGFQVSENEKSGKMALAKRRREEMEFVGLRNEERWRKLRQKCSIKYGFKKL